MRIAVTGASGRVGRAVVALAESRGHQVIGIDRIEHPDVAETAGRRFICAEIDDVEVLRKALTGCDGVVHMAAIPMPGLAPDTVVHNNNVTGSYTVLQVAAECGIRRICQASSVNAIGHAFSAVPRYDYFPLDEAHPSYAEDPYSLSKWIAEQQGEAFARRYPGMTIASLRFHLVCDDKEAAKAYYDPHPDVSKHLWAYTRRDAAADACLLSLTAPFQGHEAFFIVAPDTTSETPSLELAQQYLPEVPVRAELQAHRSFFSSAKAEKLLGWRHGHVDPSRLGPDDSASGIGRG